MAGFKKTEIGWIPRDWEVKRLGDIGSFSKGAGICKNESNSGFIPAIRYGELYTKHKEYIKKIHTYISAQVSKNSKEIKKGDILFAISGETKEEIGKCTAFINDFRSYAGGDIAILRPKNSNSIFLGYQLNSNIAQKQKTAQGQGDAVVHISINALSKILFSFPPLPEQEAIAKALTDVDNLIDTLERKIAKKRNIKQGAMQRLLTGKHRLPGFSGEWVERKLGENSLIKTGSRNGEEKDDNGIYPFYVRSQIVHRINSYSFDGEAILVPGEGGIGTIIHYINGKFDYHQRVYKISNFQDNVDGKFIFYLMMKEFNNYASKNTVKATVDSLRLPTFTEFCMFFPPTKSEQTAIAQILTDMDKEITILEQKLEKYKKIKQGMMQELLTGRIRLVKPQ